FKQCQEWLKSGNYPERTANVVLKQITDFKKLLDQEPATVEKPGFLDLKRFCLNAVKGLKNAKKLKAFITQAKTEKELLKIRDFISD
ncbi:MAG: hypothetical protein ACXQS8_07370, partial [Candidatus Helarchaeales archaeon]